MLKDRIFSTKRIYCWAAGTSGMKVAELTEENNEILIKQMGHVALCTAP